MWTAESMNAASEDNHYTKIAALGARGDLFKELNSVWNWCTVDSDQTGPILVSYPDMVHTAIKEFLQFIFLLVDNQARNEHCGQKHFSKLR